MNYTNTIIELLLFALGLSLVINATHIAFGKEMALNWLYEWLESKFRVSNLIVRFSDIRKKEIWFPYPNEANEWFYTYYDYDMYKITNEDGCRKYYKNDIEIDYEYIIYQDKWLKYRNSEGLLYIAKPIYACASCMPSLWSLPLLTILVWWKVIFIAIFAVVISTLLRDKIFE